MTAARTFTLALAGSALLAGCGGSSGGSAGGAQDAKSFCLEEAAALVPRVTACSNIDPAWAATLLPQQLECQVLGDLQAGDTLGFDETKAAACLAAVKGLSCHDLELLGYYPYQGNLPAACQAVLVPKVAAGGACHSTLGVECIDGSCDVVACNEPGTCAALARQGESCADTPCGRDLFCTPSDSTCVPLQVHESAAGEPCYQIVSGAPCDAGTACSLRCADGLSCQYERATFAYACRPRLAVGADCSENFQACSLGAVCGSTGTASLCVPSAARGGRCRPGALMCKGGLSCVADDASGTTGTCAPWPGVGGTCGLSPQGEYLPCAEGYCDTPLQPRREPAPPAAMSPVVQPANGTCQPFKARGAACTGVPGECGRFDDCSSGTCQPNVCGFG